MCATFCFLCDRKWTPDHECEGDTYDGHEDCRSSLAAVEAERDAWRTRCAKAEQDPDHIEIVKLRAALENADLVIGERIEGLLHFYGEDDAAEICVALRGHIRRALAHQPKEDTDG